MLEKVLYDRELRHSSTISYFAYKDWESVKRVLNHFQEFKICARSSGNIDVLSTLLDYEKALKKCKFTALQKRRLDLWICGYTMTEIAAMENVVISVVQRAINRDCKIVHRELVKYG